MKLTSRQESILEYVKEAHKGQVRKYTGEPYWHHLVSVADIVAPYDEEGMFLVEIALLHDVFEDTHVKQKDLESFLRSIKCKPIERHKTVYGVNSLTDLYTSKRYPELNRAQRKRLEANRLSDKNDAIHTVKYADLMDNCKSIVQHDYHFAKVYLKEKRDLLNVIRKGNLDLFVECYKSLLVAEEFLAQVELSLIENLNTK